MLWHTPKRRVELGNLKFSLKLEILLMKNKNSMQVRIKEMLRTINEIKKHK